MSKERAYKGKSGGEMDFGVRVGVVVMRGREILLVKHRKPGIEPYWVLPGGRLEPGESIPQCARRELLEETNLSARFSGVLYISEFMREGRHTVDVTVEMSVLDNEAAASLGYDPEVEPGAQPTLQGLVWTRLEGLSAIDLKPPHLKERLIEDLTDGAFGGSRSESVYLGGDLD